MKIEQVMSFQSEQEWLEFKMNLSYPRKIGEYISALVNEAAYHGKKSAYLAWGIHDKNKKVMGTNFDLQADVRAAIKKMVRKHSKVLIVANLA